MYFLHETTFNHITVISKWWEMYLKLCFTISRFFENLNLETQDGHFNCVLLKSNNIKRLKFEKKNEKMIKVHSWYPNLKNGGKSVG